MADKINEQLSALIDDECVTAEQALLLRRLSQNPDLQQRWQRYHLIGDTLKNNLPDAFDSQFCNRIQRAIAAEPALQVAATLQQHQVKTVEQKRWYQPVTGLAVAASLVVAIAAGVMVQQQIASDADEQTDTLVINQPNQPVAAEGAGSSLVAGQQSGVDKARLSDYLVNHNELASMTSVHGIMPYMRVVSYNNNP